MSFDINAKSAQLLERLANSIYDREQANINFKQHFSFNVTEIQIVEKWLYETLDEFKKALAEY